ncbi:hypothetical protein DOJK_00290 [Patescibacteria group bacterium]|nr:hypothetical protein DOJK_00290 [Patescibacteria group bacterium]
MQIEETENNNRSFRDRGDSQTQPRAERSFSDAIRCISPVVNLLLSSLKNIESPDEIKLEFGLTFNGKANLIFTSAVSVN